MSTGRDSTSKLVDYSLSASEIEDSDDPPKTDEPTPIPFRAKRVYRRIICSPSPNVKVPSPKLEDTNCEDGEPKRRTKKRWTVNDCRRLKLALKIGEPTTDEDWEAISRAIGGHRTAEECRAKAIKQFHWQQPTMPSNSTSSTGKGRPTKPIPSINVEPSDPYSDYFREHVNLSLGELDLDDTLVKEAYRSPPPGESVRCARRPFLLRPIDPLEDEKAGEDSDEENSEGGGWAK